MTTARGRLNAGGAAGFRASAQAKPRFSTIPARAQRDLPLRGRLDEVIMAPSDPESAGMSANLREGQCDG